MPPGRLVVAPTAVSKPKPPPTVVAANLHLHALVARAVARPLVPRRRVRARAARLTVAPEVTPLVRDAPTAPDVTAVQATAPRVVPRRQPLRAGGRRAHALVGPRPLLPEEGARQVPAGPGAATTHAAGGFGAAAPVAAPLGDPPEGRTSAVVAGQPLVRVASPDRRTPQQIGVVAPPLVQRAGPMVRLVGAPEMEARRAAPDTRAVVGPVGVDPAPKRAAREPRPVLDGPPLPARPRTAKADGRNVPPQGPRPTPAGHHTTPTPSETASIARCGTRVFAPASARAARKMIGEVGVPRAEDTTGQIGQVVRTIPRTQTVEVRPQVRAETRAQDDTRADAPPRAPRLLTGEVHPPTTASSTL